jgi:hypothetical protein
MTHPAASSDIICTAIGAPVRPGAGVALLT